jgi:hypothetical protein
MKACLFILFIIFQLDSFAQTLPHFTPLRYDEDYSWLQKVKERKGYQNLKFIPINQKAPAFISIGGETRLQYFYSKNEEWGDAGNPDHGYLLNRTLLHANLQAGKQFRTFVQLQSSTTIGRKSPGPVESNALEFHQAFMEWKWTTKKQSTLTVRAGRQELQYGSQRLISVREGPNNRQSFDLAKIIFHTHNTQADLLYGHYVMAKKGWFNDVVNRQNSIWGIYVAQKKIPVIENADLYYLGLWKERARFDNASGEEYRHSVGARIWRNTGNWIYDLEALVQFGTIGTQKIQAWTASINTSYTFQQTIFSPEIGVKTELISGDQRRGDQVLQTFNPLYPKGAYFGLAALIGPANLIDIHPSITLSLSNQWEMAIDHDLFWRYSKQDGLYGVNGTLIYSGTGTTEKFIGGQTTLSMTGKFSEYLNLRAELTWFEAGNYLKAAGSGKNILFTGITTQFKF